MKTSVVFYHANCMDGMASAWAMHKALGDTADYIPCNAGSMDHEHYDVTGKNIYFVDHSTTREELVRLCGVANSVTVGDHHKTAQAALANPEQWAPKNLHLRFDMEKSGARLAWELASVIHGGLDHSPLIDYVEDRDLWRWALPASEKINAYIASFPRSISVYDLINDTLTDYPHEVRDQGAAILRVIATKTANAADSALFRHDANGNLVAICNATEFHSEIGNELLKRHPEVVYTITYFDRLIGAEPQRVFSLRSRKDGYDVSAHAKKFGGGGHQAAAGFTVPLRIEFPIG